MSQIDKEIADHRIHINSLKIEIIPGDKTNNSLLARNNIHRLKLKILDLEVEHKTLKEEAYNF